DVRHEVQPVKDPDDPLTEQERRVSIGTEDLYWYRRIQTRDQFLDQYGFRIRTPVGAVHQLRRATRKHKHWIYALLFIQEAGNDVELWDKLDPEDTLDYSKVTTTTTRLIPVAMTDITDRSFVHDYVTFRHRSVITVSTDSSKTLSAADLTEFTFRFVVGAMKEYNGVEPFLKKDFHVVFDSGVNTYS